MNLLTSISESPLMLPVWYSILCGTLVGLERELKEKDAGIKTSVFLCIGAAIFAHISTHIENVQDPSRVIAQIVSGVGFIGGGVIIFDKDKIHGLTSASIIWVTAAIGILNGLNMHLEAVLSSLTIVVGDCLLGKFKQKIQKKVAKH